MRDSGGSWMPPAGENAPERALVTISGTRFASSYFQNDDADVDRPTVGTRARRNARPRDVGTRVGRNQGIGTRGHRRARSGGRVVGRCSVMLQNRGSARLRQDARHCRTGATRLCGSARSLAPIPRMAAAMRRVLHPRRSRRSGEVGTWLPWPRRPPSGARCRWGGTPISLEPLGGVF
jgi:hypothetical protein